MTNPNENPAAALQRAQILAQAGDLSGAADICRAVVARSAPNFFASFMLGTIESHFGRFAEAEKNLGQAVQLNPRSPEALTSYGNALLELKRSNDAIAALDKALALQPQNATALLYRGLALAEAGKHEAALRDFDRLLVADPRSEFALHNRTLVLIAMKRFGDAKRCVETLLRIAPGYVPALQNHAFLLTEEKNFAAALTALDRALATEPGNADLWTSRGQTLSGLGRYEDALKAFEKAIALKPASSAGPLNCANLMMEQDRLEDALSWCDKAIAVEPNSETALLLRANILLHLRRDEESMAAYDHAVAAKPDYAEAHYHRGSALLLHGRFQEGFSDFEHRWNAADCGFDRPVLQAQVWQGEPLKDKTIVVYSEQGLGDTIQFVRFLPQLVSMGARLTFLCHPNLIRLFQPFAKDIEIVATCDSGRRFDYQCALMSVPEDLGIGLESIPNDGAYLFAENALTAQWRERIGENGFKIGIGWQGNPKGAIDRGRSIPLAKFRPLSDVPGVRLVSLQRNHGLDQLEHLPQGMKVEALGAFDEGADAFIDTAAIMQNLDLIVASDTATAHLAGALGRPTWVALKHLPDWRWMLDRSDSPWYPAMRLFRQRTRGDWDGAFSAMTDALHDLTHSRRTA